MELLTKSYNIRAGAVVSCVGSLSSVALRLATSVKSNSMEVLNMQDRNFEITSLTGTLSYGGSDGSSDVFNTHLHMTVCDEKGDCKGGHVLHGCVIHTTAEIVILEQPLLQFVREYDNTTGFKELLIRARDAETVEL